MSLTRPQPISKAAWQRLGVHQVTLWTGAVVQIRIPDLTLLLAGSAVPEQLHAIALEQITNSLRNSVALQTAVATGEAPASPEIPEMTMERLQKLGELQLFLVSRMLVSPSYTEEELAATPSPIPDDDLMMLVEFASRERIVDARGVRLGVEPADRYSLWVEAHECPDDCASCARVIRALSSVELEPDEPEPDEPDEPAEPAE